MENGGSSSTKPKTFLKSKKKLLFEKYLDQKERWPTKGKVILGQFDEDSIVVYQAYNKGIASFAVENQQARNSKITH